MSLAEELATPAASIGARLRAARERAGLSIEKCADRMYLDRSVVAALEEDHFEALGGRVYARGHLRAYAELVGENAAELEAMLSPSAAAAPDVARIVTRPLSVQGRRRRIGLLPAALVTAVLLLAALVYWAMRSPQLAGAVLMGPTSGRVPTLLVASVQRDSWLEVTDAIGNRLTAGAARRGSEFALEGRAPFAVITEGNEALALEVDGEHCVLPAGLPATGRQELRVAADCKVSQP